MTVTPFAVAVPDGRLAGEATGAGDAVVLIHGMSFDRSMWDPQFPVLAARFRTVRYDLRCFGASERPAAGRGHVEDLLALLDARGARSFPTRATCSTWSGRRASTKKC
jgi:pimeloyl-ACP methyl ester carboxylesterase